MLEASLLSWFRDHHDVGSIDELRALGLSDDEVRSLVRRGVLIAVHRGVYRLVGAPETLELRARAACVANESVVVAAISAGRLWAYRRLPATTALHLVSPNGRCGLTHPGLVLRRTTDLPEEDIVRRLDGIRLTSPPRTLFDLAPLLDRSALESITEQVLDHSCTMPTLYRIGRRLTGPGRTGSTAFAELLASRPVWQRPADSDLEVRVIRGLVSFGIPVVGQHRIETRLGAIHVDAADPELRWGVEVDHVTWHGGRFDAQYDKRRDRAARLAGWQIERVTDEDIRLRFAATIAELVELRAHRLRELGAVPRA